MRFKLTLLILALSLAVPIAGTALASEEQLVHQQFGTGYYSTWRGSTTWDNGAPGTSQTANETYNLPREKLEEYTITRVKVSTGYSYNPTIYNEAGGWNGWSYDDYKERFLTYAPDNLSC